MSKITKIGRLSKSLWWFGTVIGHFWGHFVNDLWFFWWQPCRSTRELLGISKNMKIGWDSEILWSFGTVIGHFRGHLVNDLWFFQCQPCRVGQELLGMSKNTKRCRLLEILWTFGTVIGRVRNSWRASPGHKNDPSARGNGFRRKIFDWKLFARMRAIYQHTFRAL